MSTDDLLEFEANDDTKNYESGVLLFCATGKTTKRELTFGTALNNFVRILYL